MSCSPAVASRPRGTSSGAAPAGGRPSAGAPAPRFEPQKVWVGHSCPTHTHSVGQRTVVMPITLAPAQQEEMLSAARDAFRNAHAPYSNFKVGATILTERGTMYHGCNVENASYGLTICAERNAIFAAVAAEGSSMR